jgi:glycosyltransferase involved in cell wall biosynthesis
MPDLKVDLVVDQLRRAVPGGIGTYCLGLLQGLRSLPAEACPAVTLRASRPTGAARRRDPLAELGVPLRSSLLPGAVLTTLWNRDLPAGWLAPRPRRATTGRGTRRLVHASSFAAPPVRRLPLVTMVHDLAWRRFPEAYPPHGRAWHERALRLVARSSVEIVVPSEVTASDLLAAGLGVRAERVHVVPEGADHLAPPDFEAAAELLERLGLPPGSEYLLTVGTLEPRKNLSRLVEAYGRARPHLAEPWPLVVVGPKGWSGGDAALAAGMPGVVAAGPARAGVLSALYARSRCTAYVPVLEGFGLPAAEAMAAGAPVVATRGLPSVAGAALEVDPFDVEEIAAALVEAATDGEARARLVAAGTSRAAMLTWEACARAHVAIWAEAVELASERATPSTGAAFDRGSGGR